MAPIRRSSAFTLLELIASVAILAVLVTMSVVFVGGYVTEARKIADKQSLTVLNEAINRYKCQGGNVNALTSGKAKHRLLAALQTEVDWAGTRHQFLQSGFTVPAGKTLAATGERSAYRLTQYGSYIEEQGGTPVTGLAFDGIVQSGSHADTATTQVITLSVSIPVGKRAVLAVRGDNAPTITGITDSKSNSWTVDAMTGGFATVNLASAQISNALISGDTITLTWSDIGYNNQRPWSLMTISGAAGGTPATIYNGGAWSFNYNFAAANVNTVPAVCIGILFSGNANAYTGSNWTVLREDWGTRHSMIVYTVQSTTGSKAPGGSVSVATNAWAAWAAYK